MVHHAALTSEKLGVRARVNGGQFSASTLRAALGRRIHFDVFGDLLLVDCALQLLVF